MHSSLIPRIISTNKDSLTTVLHARHNTFQHFANIIPFNFIKKVLCSQSLTVFISVYCNPLVLGYRFKRQHKL
jgi:hypothetical protein